MCVRGKARGGSASRQTALVVMLMLIIGSLFIGMAPAGAQDDVVLRGTLRSGRDPIDAVTLSVVNSAGAEVGTTTTGADGKWEVPINAADTYTITIDEATLPEGIGFKGGNSNVVEREVTELRTFSVGFQLEAVDAQPLVAIDSTTTRVLNRVASGIKVGLLVALASVGLSLIYGVTGLVNFAHSEMVTFGAVIAFGIEALMPSVPFPITVLLAVIVGGALGFLLERGLFRPLRKRKMNNISLMIVSIGLAFVLRYAIVIYFRAEPVGYKHYLIQTGTKIGPISLPMKDWVIIVVAFVLLLAVGLLLQKTRLGTAMRAVADNPPLAQSSGINVDSTILAVWIAGSALAAAGGIFLGLTQVVEWQMGEKMLLLIFAAVTLGGLGTAYGAMVGGLVIGLASEVITLHPWVDSNLKFGVALLVLILVLLVRPQGILGVRERFG